MKPSVSAIAAAAGAALAALAGDAAAETAQAAAWKEQMLSRKIALESRSHRERIRILQEADACIHAARDFPQYRECEQRENEAREALRARLRPEQEALRGEFEQRVAAYRDTRR